MVISGIGAILLLLVILLVLATLAWGALSAAPWVPLPRRDVKRLLELARVQPGELVYDLGCGDGRLVVAAAKLYGARAVGFEVALVPYLFAKLRVWLSGVADRATIRYQNFWPVPLTPADAVVCFLTPYAMAKLEPKFTAEAKPGARLVSYAFRFHQRQPSAVSKPQPH